MQNEPHAMRPNPPLIYLVFHTVTYLSKLPRMLPLLLPFRQLDQRRSRNRVARKHGKDIEQNTGVIGLVEARRRHASTQLGRATSANLDIDALRVGLRAVCLAGGVQGEDLVAEDVVAWREVRDGKVPAEVVLDQVVGDPGAGVVTGFPGRGLDFRPRQGGGGDGGEVPGYWSDVFLDGPDVRGGPCVLLVAVNVTFYNILHQVVEQGKRDVRWA
jgi:hypothetical protein